jgi:hypothetical protein
MITIFEKFISNVDTYLIGEKSSKCSNMTISRIMDYLCADVGINILGYADYPKSVYGIDIVDFVKEIFLNKSISFNSVDRDNSNPRFNGKVEDVSHYIYQDDFFIKVKLFKDNDWHLMEENSVIFVYDYDADKKPLHKKMYLKKDEERYNV